MIICCKCGRDIDAIGQDNMSNTIGYPLCEDCSRYIEDDYNDYDEEQEIYVWRGKI